MRIKLREIGELGILWLFTFLALVFDWLPNRIKQSRLGLFFLSLCLLVLLAILYQCTRKELTVRLTPMLYTYYLPIVFPSQDKRGAISATCDEQNILATSWYYNYSGVKQNCTQDFVPMIWGETFIDYPMDESDWLLGFNEPEMSNQANLTPEHAAELWRKIESKYPNRKLASPATLTGLATTDWLQRFYQAYADQYGVAPRLDAIAIHWYGWDSQNAIDSLQGIINQATIWNVKEIWLTEFAFLANSDVDLCWGRSQSDELPEAQKFIDWLDTLAATEKRLANAQDTIAQLRADLAAMTAERDAMRAALESINPFQNSAYDEHEWNNCLWCGKHETDGHAKDCKYATMIAATPAPHNGDATQAQKGA